MTGLRTLRAVLLVGCCALLLACAEKPPPETPPPPVAKPAAIETIHVVVQRGQSLGRIAQSYHVTKQDIISANNLQPPYRLKVGMVLTIRLPVSFAKKVETLRKPHRAAGQREHPKQKEPEVIPLD
jgi:LysM repeat protein